MPQHQLIFGQHAVNALLSSEPERIYEIFVVKTRQDAKTNLLINTARKQGIPVHFCHKKTLDEKSSGKQHQGILARAKQLPERNENDLDTIIKEVIAAGKQITLLILDAITDPHNLGACMRTADSAGIDAVIVPKDKSVGLTASVRKVACGAAESVPLIRVTNLVRTIKEIQQLGVWVIGTAGEADIAIYESKLDGHLALVMGAEDKGLRRLTRENCDQLVKLPMKGSVSSLNVSVATGICLYEILRQRDF